MDRAELRQLIERLAPSDGARETGLDGVQLFRVSHPVKLSPTIYLPGVCLLVSGSKKVCLSGKDHVYNVENFFCCTMPMPVEAETLHASAENPLLGLTISLESPVLADTAIEIEASASPSASMKESEIMPGLAVVEQYPDFDEAVLRLLQLVGDGNAMDVLGPGRLREVFYSLLTSGAGTMVRQAFGVSSGIARSIRFVRENLSAPIAVEDLADKAGMSRAVFHRKFKEATTLSPLQFVKNLKLNEAARNMATGMPVSQAALLSGYASSSQFSREFKRMFGASPRDWLNERSGS